MLICPVGIEIRAPWVGTGLQCLQRTSLNLDTSVHTQYIVTIIKSRPLVSRRSIFRRKDYFYNSEKHPVVFGKLLCTPLKPRAIPASPTLSLPPRPPMRVGDLGSRQF